MPRGKSDLSALALPAIMAAVGLSFLVIGAANLPAFLLAGLLYGWIGLRGIWANLPRAQRQGALPSGKLDLKEGFASRTL